MTLNTNSDHEIGLDGPTYPARRNGSARRWPTMKPAAASRAQRWKADLW
ncbi:MAG: hypothetical protein JWR46_3428 [Mycobacterium sp.]|nr:hypothetical protein [Mycobacterium sp.]